MDNGDFDCLRFNDFTVCVVKMQKKALTVLIGLLMLATPVFSASTTYYAKATIYFNIPVDASFSIAMPNSYASWQSITGMTEGTATQTTDWISFNFSSHNSATLIQPYQLGEAEDTQNGATKPIFYIHNTGNVNESFKVYMGSALPSGISLYVNTTSNGCGTLLSALTIVPVSEGSSLQVASSCNTTDYLNITLYANTSYATTGETNRAFYVKSTAV